jgi:hypothetical protein
MEEVDKGVHFRMSNLPPDTGKNLPCGPDRVLLQFGPKIRPYPAAFCTQIKTPAATGEHSYGN